MRLFLTHMRAHTPLLKVAAQDNNRFHPLKISLSNGIIYIFFFPPLTVWLLWLG